MTRRAAGKPSTGSFGAAPRACRREHRGTLRSTVAVLAAVALLPAWVVAPAAAAVTTPPVAAPPQATSGRANIGLPASSQAANTFTLPESVLEPEPAAPTSGGAGSAGLAAGQKRYTPYSESIGQADGTVATTLYQAPAYTRDAKGVWSRTGDDVTSTGDSERPERAAKTYRPIVFGSDPAAMVTVELADGDVSIGNPAFAKVKPSKIGRTLKYRAVAKDVDVDYDVTAAAVTERIILRSDKAPRSFRFHISDPKGQLGLPVAQPGGGYRFSSDIGDGVRLTLDAPAAYELPSAPDEPVGLEPGSAQMTVVKAGDGFDVIKAVDEDWLRGKNFPIVLDPALRFDASTDCWLRGGANVNVRWCFNSLVAGNLSGDPSRTVLNFGIRGVVPLGSRIDSANFNIYQTGNTFGGSQTVTLSRQRATQPFTNDATWNTYNGTNSWTTVGSVVGGGPGGNDLGSFQQFITSSTTAGYRSVSDTRLTAQVQRWTDELDPDTGIHLRTLESTNNGYVRWSSSKQTSTQWPYLQLSYTPPSLPRVETFVATDRSCATPIPATTTQARTLQVGAVFAVCSRVTNTNTFGTAVDANVNTTVPAGLTPIRLPAPNSGASTTLLLDNRECFDLDPVTIGACFYQSPSGNASKRLPINGSLLFSYAAQVDGDNAGCRSISVSHTARSELVFGNPGGSITSTPFVIKACEGGLGNEHWWTFDARRAGPHADYGVNVGNGNLVLQALDGTPVQGHGQLSLFLRRTYNSRDTALTPLPGTIGAGWTLSTGDAGDLAGAGVTPTGVTIPSLGDVTAAVTNPLSVVLNDRDGTKHRFTRRGDGFNPATLVAVPASVTDQLGALAARALTIPSGYVLCVDTSYDPPPGVHVSLWRYLAVLGNSCSTGTVGAQSLLGYVTMRPDRLRSEFDALGRLRHLTDATGNQLAYTYRTAGTRGIGALAKIAETRAGTEFRALTFDYPAATTDTVISDSAGRTIVYSFTSDPVAGLNNSPVPAGTTPAAATARLDTVSTYRGPVTGELLARERYAYWGVQTTNGLSCPAGSQQPTGVLCAASDPRGTEDGTSSPSQPMTFSYDSTDRGSARLAQHTDRRGTLTRYTYLGASTIVDHNPSGDRGYDNTGTLGAGTADQPHRVIYSGIDSRARVARIDRGTPGGTSTTVNASSTTQNSWDADRNGQSCRLPAATDNNLCITTEGTAGGENNRPYLTDYTYGEEGQLLRRTTYAGASRTLPLHETWSWTSQYRGRQTATCRDYTAPGAGTVLLAGSGCTGSTDPATLYALTDMTSELSPRGNGDSSETGRSGRPIEDFRTVHSLDNNAAQAPNQPIARTAFGNAATACGVTTSPPSNSGLRCSTRQPRRTSTDAVTRYGYNPQGQRTTMLTPLALTRSGRPAAMTGDATGIPGYTYTYYGTEAGDIAPLALDGTPANGWLKAVTDPAGKFVHFAHDSAGNVARTWDRNRTSGSAQTFQSSSPGFTEELRGPADYRAPWRYVTSHRTVEGRRSAYTLDDNGNVLEATPPRGFAESAMNPATHATKLSYNGDDQPLTIQRPEDTTNNRTRLTYDRYGNQVRSTDPNDHVTATSYTSSNQPQVVATVRGTTATSSGAGSDSEDCYNTDNTAPDLPGGLPAALPPGHIACTTVATYDDGRLITGTRDGHRITTYTFRDHAGRAVRHVTPRDTGRFLYSQTILDNDGQALRTCNPRAFGFQTTHTDSTLPCTSTQVHAEHHSYNGAGLVEATTRYRDTTTIPLVTRSRYDTDGNPIAISDPNSNIDPAANNAPTSAPRYETTHDFDLLNRLTQTTTPRSGTATPTLNTTTSFVYDPVGNPVLTTWPDGQRDAKAYDDDHRQTDAVSGYTGAIELGGTRPAVADIKTATSSLDGGSNTHTRTTFDDNSNITIIHTPRAFTTSGTPDDRFSQRLSYDRNNRPVRAEAARYDTADPALDDATGATPGSSTDQQRTQCPTGTTGWPATVGVCTTTIAYDFADNRTRLRLPTSQGSDRRFIDYQYSHDNLVTAVLSPDPSAPVGQVTNRMGYDGTGRQVRSTTPTTTLSASGRTTITEYNADGTTRRVTAPARDPRIDPPSDPSAGPRVTAFDYDPAGNPTTTTDPLGQIASRLTSSDGLITRNIDTGGNTTDYSFDRNGNPTTVTSPNRTSSRYTYTLDNLLVSLEKPGLADSSTYQTTYGYDLSGRKSTARTVRTGGTAEDSPSAQTFAYYPNNRLRQETGRATQTQGAGTISTCYTADGLPTRIADLPPGDTTTPACTAAAEDSDRSILARGYYLDGKLRTAADGQQTLRYGYDALGKLTARIETPTSQASNATRHVYNDAALPTTMTADGFTGLNQPAWTRAYDNNGRPLTETQPNGQQLAWTHADDNTLSNQTLTTRDGATTVHSYTYDKLLRQRSQSLQRGGTTSTDSYTYDAAGRLSSFTDGDTSATTWARWDANGNRICWGITCSPNSTPAPTEQTSYNPDDSLRRELGSNVDISYDGAGRRIRDSTACYQHDGFDRLTTTVAATPGPACPAPSLLVEGAQYSYDGLDRQRRRTTTGPSSVTQTATGPNPARLTYDADTTRLLRQTPTSGSTGTVRTVIDTAGLAVGNITGTNSPHLLTSDGHGNTATDVDAMLSSTGATSGLSCFTRYTPFGQTRGGTSGPAGQPSPCQTGQGTGLTSNEILFSNERRDPNTGDYQLGPRTYQPDQATFLTPDHDRREAVAAQPGIGFDPLTANTYTYVNGDPVNFVDPSGHIRCSLTERQEGCTEAGEGPEAGLKRRLLFDFRLRQELPTMQGVPALAPTPGPADGQAPFTSHQICTGATRTELSCAPVVVPSEDFPEDFLVFFLDLVGAVAPVSGELVGLYDCLNATVAGHSTLDCPALALPLVPGPGAVGRADDLLRASLNQRLASDLRLLLRSRAGFDAPGLPLVIDNSIGANPERTAAFLRQNGINARSVNELFGGDPGDPSIRLLAEQLGASVLSSDRGRDGLGFGALRIPINQKVRDPRDILRLLREGGY
jgi:RHS repeat-associated protein